MMAPMPPTTRTILNFLSFLSEGLKDITIMTHPAYKAHRGDDMIKGLVNPSSEEILGLLRRSSEKEVRFAHDFHTKTLYVWKAEDAVHMDVVGAFARKDKVFMGTVAVDVVGKGPMLMSGDTNFNMDVHVALRSIRALSRFVEDNDVNISELGMF